MNKQSNKQADGQATKYADEKINKKVEMWRNYCTNVNERTSKQTNK